jgi:hypothetical protein
MPTLAARAALATVWRLIFASESRPLVEQELAGLRRACDTLLRQVPGNDRFNDEAEQLCLAIHSSSIFESGVARQPERLLEYIDALNESLN